MRELRQRGSAARLRQLRGAVHGQATDRYCATCGESLDICPVRGRRARERGERPMTGPSRAHEPREAAKKRRASWRDDCTAAG